MLMPRTTTRNQRGRGLLVPSLTMIASLVASIGAGGEKVELIERAKRGDLAEVEALISGGSDLDAVDGKGKTALMESARTGKTEVVRALIAAGASLDLQDRDGWTAAMRAVMARQIDTLELLVAGGADVRLENEKGENALHVAVGYGTGNIQPDMVGILARAGLSPDQITVRGKPPLLYAIDSLQDKLVAGLLKAGADPNAVDSKGRPALVLAAQSSNLGQAPAMVASLLAAGADADARDAKGVSALEHAVDISKSDYKKASSRKSSAQVTYILARSASRDSIRAAQSVVWSKGFALFDTLMVKAKQEAPVARPDGGREAAREARRPPPEGCPASSGIASISSGNEEFAASQPLDLTAIVSAKAVSKREGQRLKVFLANAPFTARQMDNSMVIPVKEKGQAVIVLSFMNGGEAIDRSEYTPAAGYGKAHSVSAEVQVKGTRPAGSIIGFVSASAKEQGTATITAFDEQWVCGSFDLKGSLGAVAGRFVAEVEAE